MEAVEPNGNAGLEETVWQAYFNELRQLEQLRIGAGVVWTTVTFDCRAARLCYHPSMQVTVDIPDEFVEQIVPAGRDAARSLLEESVAGAYRSHRLTMEQVRELLGFSTRMQVDLFLQEHEIYDYSVEDLSRDMDSLDRLAAAKAE